MRRPKTPGVDLDACVRRAVSAPESTVALNSALFPSAAALALQLLAGPASSSTAIDSQPPAGGQPTGQPAPQAPIQGTQGAPTTNPKPPQPRVAPLPKDSEFEGQPAPTIRMGLDLAAILSDERPPPTFTSQNFQLSEVLREVIKLNPDLRTRVVEREVSEAQIMAALGAYDLRLTSGADFSLENRTPRSDAFVATTGTVRQDYSIGLSRSLETGGRIDLKLGFGRSLDDRPISFLDPTAGSVRLGTYYIEPRLELNHPLLRGLGVEFNMAAIRRAKLARTQAEAAELQTSQELVRDVLLAYWDLAFAEKSLANTLGSAQLAREQYRRVEAQVEAGRSSPVDAKAAARSVVTKESEVLRAESQVLERSLQLHALMGHDLSRIQAHGIHASTDPVFVEFANLELDSEIDRAIEVHPQLRQFELALATRRIEELERANARLPQLDLSVSFSSRGISAESQPDLRAGTVDKRASWGEAFRNFGARNADNRPVLADFAVTAGLTFSWDIQNRTARAQHESAILEIRKAEINLAKLRQTVAADVVRWVVSYRNAAQRLQTQELAVELAVDNLEAENASYEVGRSTVYDVLERIDELTLSRGSALEAKIELIKAKTQLQALNGELLPAYGLDLARDAKAEPAAD